MYGSHASLFVVAESGRFTTFSCFHHPSIGQCLTPMSAFSASRVSFLSSLFCSVYFQLVGNSGSGTRLKNMDLPKPTLFSLQIAVEINSTPAAKSGNKKHPQQTSKQPGLGVFEGSGLCASTSRWAIGAPVV